MYFDNCRTEEEAKRTYRRLAMLHHPDRGGSTAVMQDINAEYSAFTVRRTTYTPPRQEPPKKTRKPRKRTCYTQAAIDDLIQRARNCANYSVWVSPDRQTVVVEGDIFKTIVAHFYKRDQYGDILWTARKYNKTPAKYAVHF